MNETKRPAIRSVRDRLNGVRQELRTREDPVIANLRRGLREARRAGGLDVLQLGDSMLTWRHPSDVDQRLFPAMIQDALPDRRVIAIHGPGYHMGVYERILRNLVARGRVPKLVIVPLTYRQCAQMWDRHPRNGYAHATKHLDRLSRRGRPTPVWAPAQAKDPAVMDAFRALQHPCLWEGPRDNGTFIDLIRGGRRGDPETVAHTYAYLHGEALRPDLDAVVRVTRFGAYTAALGIPVVAYENPVNVETGEKHWGEKFTRQTERNIQLVSDALVVGTGPLGRVARTGTTVGAESFIDPDDGIEHQRGDGRAMLARSVAELVASAGW
jgi:hypothetical protein